MELIEYTEDLKKNRTFKSAKECAKILGVSERVLNYSIKNTKEINGFFYQYNGRKISFKEKKYKCPYCERSFDTYLGLSAHVNTYKAHGEVSKEQLLTDFKYGGIRPVCKCGCGGYTKIDHNGEPHYREYITGHNSRIVNNFDCEKAKTKSAETRRKQFKAGERHMWIEGKKWTDVFTEEEIADLKSRIFTKERNQKISNFFKGKPKSPEHAEKCREIGKSERTRKILSEKLHNRLENLEFSISSTAEDDFVIKFIEPLGIPYIRQFYIPEIKQYCDIFFPDKNIVVEYDGDFWHCNPEKYPEGPTYDYQKKHIEKDKIKNEFLVESGVKLIRLWESDVLGNPETIREKLKNEIV